MSDRYPLADHQRADDPLPVPGWALTEPVDLTRLPGEDVLVARVLRPGAFVIGRAGNRMLINGNDLDLGDHFIDFVSLVDDVADVLIGRTYRSHPFGREEDVLGPEVRAAAERYLRPEDPSDGQPSAPYADRPW